MLFESMDQRAGLRSVMLAETENAQPMAFPLCEADAAHRSELVGETLDLVLRRTQDQIGTHAPIFYQRKLAAPAATRMRLKQTRKEKDGQP
ncbi:MAG: hypothetical protein JOZ55_10105 [Alphaproteobacteria bacterium]|nr:hypothetical protein [Alphaproteobacteria bacterium]